MSGVTFFTLGYGDAVLRSVAARLVTVLEAGTGIDFIAFVIVSLPTRPSRSLAATSASRKSSGRT